MTLLEAVIAQAAAVGESIEDLVTDATPEQSAMDMAHHHLSDFYAHVWGRRYVFVPGFENGRNIIVDAHRAPFSDTGPLLTRLY